MQLIKARRFKKRHKYLGALIAKNPVLVLGLDLPFVIATSTSVRNAAAMSLEMFIIHIGTMLLAMITARYMKSWGRMLANVSLSTLMMVLARLLLLYPMRGVFPGLSESVGMYIYLMSVNGMTLVQANTLDKTLKLWPVAANAFMNALGFALTVLSVSVLREYFGNGSLWGVPLPAPFKLEGLLIPFSGFIIMGFLLAGMRYLNKLLLKFSLSEHVRKQSRFSVVDV